MPSIAEAGVIFELVEADVEQGLGAVFPGGAGFALAEPGERGGIAGENVEAVVWTWNGQDTVGFQGLQPTGAEVTVSGITLIERDPVEEFTYRRYVDWLAVAHQLGLSFDGRPTVKGPPPPP